MSSWAWNQRANCGELTRSLSPRKSDYSKLKKSSSQHVLQRCQWWPRNAAAFVRSGPQHSPPVHPIPASNSATDGEANREVLRRKKNCCFRHANAIARSQASKLLLPSSCSDFRHAKTKKWGLALLWSPLRIRGCGVECIGEGGRGKPRKRGAHATHAFPWRPSQRRWQADVKGAAPRHHNGSSRRNIRKFRQLGVEQWNEVDEISSGRKLAESRRQQSVQRLTLAPVWAAEIFLTFSELEVLLHSVLYSSNWSIKFQIQSSLKNRFYDTRLKTIDTISWLVIRKVSCFYAQIFNGLKFRIFVSHSIFHKNFERSFGILSTLFFFNFLWCKSIRAVLPPS